MARIASIATEGAIVTRTLDDGDYLSLEHFTADDDAAHVVTLYGIPGETTITITITETPEV